MRTKYTRLCLIIYNLWDIFSLLRNYDKKEVKSNAFYQNK